jgi:phage-related tail protein
MSVTTYQINNLMKSYSRQNRIVDQGRKKVTQIVNDTVKISSSGKKRIFERMKEQAIDQIKIQNREK